MTTIARGSGGGFDLELELDRSDLLPGRLVGGRFRVTTRRGGAFRGARVTLVGVETWRYDQTTTDSEGRTQTVTRTAREALPAIPIAVIGATTIAAGESREVPFQLPVPGLGPATFEGTELRVDWELTANLDVSGFDPGVTLPVRILQPTALLRAGVVDVAQFALFDDADVAADDLRGSISLAPVPLCVGAPFRGRIALTEGSPRRVQEVRLELRVVARSTVSGGREESITLWAGQLAGAGAFGGAGTAVEFAGTIDDHCLPTIRTPHGRADATFRVVVARSMAHDPNLVRDVALCSTMEI
ncbi:MAG: sporulation protein [Chloroflexota bacterium]